MRSEEDTHQEQITEIVQKRRKNLNPMMSISYYPHPLKVARGQGQYFYEKNGEKVLDCINNVSHIGHCHPYYVEKMQKQLEVLLTNSRFLYDQIMEATEKLLSTLPKELCVVTFTNSGSEANDLALQMAEIHTSKKGIICLEGAYHGITRSCHQISPYKWNRDSSKAQHVQIASSPCTYRGILKGKEDPSTFYAEYLDEMADENVGTFICQYMQSCAGQIVPPQEMYKKVYEKLKRKGVVCIGDEVQTGFGRIGTNFWAFEHYGVIPDILTVGKAMGNGFPVSAVITTQQISNSYKQRGIQFFSTFGGNPLASTAVSTVLDVIKEEDLQRNALETGEYLQKKLKELLKYDFVGDIRGFGLFQGIDVVKDKESKIEDGDLAKRIILKMRAKGVLVSRDGIHGNVLKIKPPLVFTKENVDELIQTFETVIAELQS